ncbi:S-layer family protein [Geminocystis sp. NIES-3709]|uniref:beta strand repeat-containing protein n=1 Tax=Geminocystis sp. NIES-3709 TaxID=1617448 RepID=UPI0005FC76BE|nr:hypothetical protein [Geminocystis sp. NIES-3709]BAQ65169.1 alkaline phosphatase [Geminocystis sp. NIES-3709]
MATYTLTINGDNLIGTTGNDTFNGTYDGAVTDTFGANDFLNGDKGIDTLHLDHLLDVAITPPDNLWTNLKNIENIEINTTGNGAQTITTGVNFQTAFASNGVELTTTTSGAGAIDITMTTFTGVATLKTTSGAGAQNIVTGSGATTVEAISGAGALNIKGVGLNTVFATTTGAGAQTIGDGSGNGVNLTEVTATSAGGAQTITSTSINDVVVKAISSAGKQIITTGSGSDIITASTTSATNIINTGDGNDKVTIFPTTSGNYSVNGGKGNDTITGGAGNDTFTGGVGNDILNGGKGVDNMMGGDGSDLYYVDIATDVVNETNTFASIGGIDTVRSDISYTLTINVENLILQGTEDSNGTGNILDNVLTGNNFDNRFNGSGGDDTLNGRGGNDTLTGGIGEDSMIGGTGDDIFYVDNTNDRVVEFLNEGIDTVRSTIAYTLTDNVENLILEGTEDSNGTGNILDNVLTGNNFDNRFNGNDGDDTLNSRGGNDTLTGGIGEDSMIGGTGDDIFYVDNTNDRVVEFLNEGIDTVRSIIAYTLTDNVDNLILEGTEDLNGTGNTLDNSLTGNNYDNRFNGSDGNDTLNGRGGNDTLTGGLGNDNLTGGINTDFFLFNSVNEGIDRITDFNITDDSILIRRNGFGGGLSLGTLPVNQFHIGSSATTSSDRFIYNSSNGGLFFDVDGSGATAATQIATLNTGLTTMSNQDIFVI